MAKLGYGTHSLNAVQNMIRLVLISKLTAILQNARIDDLFLVLSNFFLIAAF